MTPSERAVIDAARALVPDLHALVDEMVTDDYGNRVVNDAVLRRLEKVAPAFVAAVRALPRPLSEQLAELRVGVVVEVADGQEATVLCVHEPSQTLFLQWCFGRPESRFSATGTFYFRDIRRIISNPEASNG